MRDTNAVFLEVMRKNALMEVSDNRLAAAQKYPEHKVEQSRKFIDGHLDDMNKNFKPRIKPDSSAAIKDGYKELIRKEREQISINRAYIEKRKRQAERFKNALETRKAKANRAVNVRRAKIAGGVGAVGLGAYGAYRYYKHRKNQQQKAKESTSQYFARMLREAETRINADHIALGLNVLKATGFDQAMARQMGDDKQRSQAWKYGLRGAAVGASLPALEYGAKTAYELGNHVMDARRNGIKGVGNILKYARDQRFGAWGHSPLSQFASELGRHYTDKPALVGKVVGGLAGAGALYGLMKKAPNDKKPAITMMKPKKQYKYIRKENNRYVYPKQIGVRR